MLIHFQHRPSDTEYVPFKLVSTEKEKSACQEVNSRGYQLSFEQKAQEKLKFSCPQLGQ